MSEQVKQDELRDYIKDNVDLMDYIETFYPHVRFTGNNTLKAVCPLPGHSENTGSFLIKDGEQTFKCFGCGIGGDIFTFVQEMEGVDFLEAMNLIADNMGYEVKSNNSTLNSSQKKYLDTIKTYNIRYRKNLKDNEEALEYLTEKRQISLETINNFLLGLTNSDEHNYRENLKGLINNSITFPLCLNTPKRQVVANAYKSLDGKKEPKYINDTAKDMFVKSELLYGYPQAYKHMRATKCAYIVEGYFDVIAMHEAGLKNTVGAMCASISDKQIETIKRLCNKVIIMLDNDPAGNKGKLDAIPRFLEHGLEVEVFESKEYKDPDDICKKFLFIKESVEEYINDRTYNAIVFTINENISKYETLLMKAQMDTYKSAMKVISKIQDEAEKQFQICRLKKRLDMK